MNNIFLHTVKPDMMPVDTVYVNITDLINQEDGTIDNIIVQDLFDYLENHQVVELLQVIREKLSAGGKLHIQATDLKQLAIAIAFNDIDIELAKKIMYPHKRSISLLTDTVKLLNDNKFKIETSYYTNVFEYYLIGIKNV